MRIAILGGKTSTQPLALAVVYMNTAARISLYSPAKT
jgi:hypothetical protein